MDVDDGHPGNGTQDRWEPPGFEQVDPSAPTPGAPAGDDEAPAGTMTVELGGEVRELPAQRDYTGDGLPDAATETADGRVIVFADTGDNATGAAGPDGKADEAYVVDKRTGRVVGTAHLDPRTGEWVDGTDGGEVSG